MTESLAEKTCTPCRGGVPPLPRDEALRFQAQAPDWELRDISIPQFPGKR
jgi:4a-hydroxytetrahydrobiopterin dehydratase